jgi:hypothetical protein
MPSLTDFFYEKTKNAKTSVYIETGTYLGNGIKRVFNDYSTIHSIELSEKWYNYNVDQFKNDVKVKMHLGDSKKILPTLLSQIDEPVTIYLDAHYSGVHTEFGEEETPLLSELEILKDRVHDDIIIIDDCRILGKKGVSGRENDEIYPLTNYDWTDVTEEKIINLMRPGYVLLKNDNYEYINYHRNDQYVLAKNNS